MGAFPFGNRLYGSDNARVEVQQWFSQAGRKSSFHQRLNAAHEHLCVAIVARDDHRLRDQKCGASMKDDSLQE